MYKFLACPAIVAGTVTAMTLVTALSAAAASTTLIDETYAGPFGSAELCVAERCVPVSGVKDLHIKVSYDGVEAGLPKVEEKPPASCKGDKNIYYKMTTSGSGKPGSVTPLVEFDMADKNGDTIPRTHRKYGGDPIPVGASVQREFDPLISFCGKSPAVPSAPTLPPVPPVPMVP